MAANNFNIKSTFNFSDNKTSFVYFDLNRLSDVMNKDIHHLPFSIKVLIENLLRHSDKNIVNREHIEALCDFGNPLVFKKEIPFMPARVLMQDFTGVPALVDMAAMRNAAKRFNINPSKINPQIPVDLIVDHSVSVDKYGCKEAFSFNADKEFQQNKERYAFLKWGQSNFKNFNVIPPATGICHQVNLEYLSKVVSLEKNDSEYVVFPDTVVGLDSHTTMINGLGVVGWGVGGIEAEAVMLGQPYYMLIPQVIGFKLSGSLKKGVTSTDLVLTITQILRKKGVVGKFIEFFGSGLTSLTIPDRATVANMSPEFGATISFFPVDAKTLDYMRLTGKKKELIQIIEAYCKCQKIFRTDKTPDPVFTEYMELNLESIEPCIAGPKRPHDRILLKNVKESFQKDLKEIFHKDIPDNKMPIDHGSVVIAAITSCTNTSNPSVLIGAGLLAKKAVERGLKVKPHVKTSFAPGSKVVAEYLQAAGLLEYLEKLNFHLTAFGCTTCIGNSGPLPEHIRNAIQKNDLVAAAVLSGNRNFEGRINPYTKANYLLSPILVVAYAISGTMNIDFMKEPIGLDQNGKTVYLKDILPDEDEINDKINIIKPEMFINQYNDAAKGDLNWQSLQNIESEFFQWDLHSTYLKEPPFFKDINIELPELGDISNARILALFGNFVTTDHISPAGNIPASGVAGKYLIKHGVIKDDFNSFGSRRGNHDVMVRGTFANVRIKNLLLPDTEGGTTVHFPSKDILPIYEASVKYQQEGVPLCIIAGKEYGSGSSRDWAAKGTKLLGIKAVIAESFERIHRSNLVAMGILPLQFMPDENYKTFGLTGEEILTIQGIKEELLPLKKIQVKFNKQNNESALFNVIVRLDSMIEVEYYKNGGILPYVLRKMFYIS